MASYVPAKKGVEFIFYIGLESVATAGAFQANATLASGDCKTSLDGAALANLATLPVVTPASSKLIKVTLSAAEMNGDNVTVICSDASGGEWKDLIVSIQTAARQIDDLATPANVNAEVLDVLTTDTFAEVSAVPAATSTLKDKINWLFALARNKITQTATTQTLRNDADSGNVATSAQSDDATTYVRSEWS